MDEAHPLCKSSTARQAAKHLLPGLSHCSFRRLYLNLVLTTSPSLLKMRFATAISALLCAEVALGARWTEKRRESRAARQISKRNGATRKSQPMIKSDFSGVESNNSYVEYSSNWAGAVISSSGFTEVTGTVTVPTLTTSSSGTTESAGSAVSILFLTPTFFRPQRYFSA